MFERALNSEPNKKLVLWRITAPKLIEFPQIQSRRLEPSMTEEESQLLKRSIDRLKAASERIGAVVY
jgi:hypothetical protein